MAIHKLIDLDFSPGIKAEHINANFQLIYDWLKRERLRVGGWGLVEGFDLSYDPDAFTVTVGKGTLINQDGDEVDVPAVTLAAGEVDYNHVTKRYQVDENGRVFLDSEVYDYRYHRYLTYNPPNTIQEFNDSVLEVMDDDEFNVPVVRVIGKFLWVSERLAGQWISVTQCVGQDRIDTIMLHKDGTYEYLWSIDSPSPSHVDLADYDETFCIAVAYWQVSAEGTTCDFFTNHRSYRKIYVDKSNTLYINGEVYKKQKFIYFVEPSDPEENDLWYNIKDNTLYIWRQVDGEWGWIIVNDHSEIIIKERKVWYPEDNPVDLQTFIFEDEELNLRYVPGTSALDIVIDNAPLMSDQYTEISTTEQDINTMHDKIKEVQKKISDKQQEIDALLYDKKNIDGTIQVLRKDLQDSKDLYPEAYDVNDKNYSIRNNDIPNLRNLMVINQRIAKALEDLSDLLSKITSAQKLLDTYKEELAAMEAITAGAYVSRGMGFKLKRPLSHPAYVEVIVTHQVRMKPAREVFQRAAIFIKEGDITVTEDGSGQLFRTATSYSLGDYQLEVFVDGVKLSRGLQEFCETIDNVKEDKEAEAVIFNYNREEQVTEYRGTASSHFRVMTQLTIGQTVSYRISKHVWSYDQLDTIISSVKSYAVNALSKATQALDTANGLQTNVIETLAAIRNDISIIKSEADQVSQCYKRGFPVSYADIPDQVKTELIGIPFDIVKPATAIKITFEGVVIEKDADGVIVGGDIFQLYYVTSDSSRILIREGKSRNEQDIDYWVTRRAVDIIDITLRDDLVASDANLYMVGFKRGVST